MSEIIRTLDDTGQLNAWYQGVVKKLARRFLDDQEDCILFLGAGAALDSHKPHLPSGADLSRKLAQHCHLEWHSYIPLSTIAFYYEFFFRRDDLNQFLKDEIDITSVEPSGTVEKLMNVIEALERRDKDVLVMTTNYDQHFERAYGARFGKPPGIIIYNGGTDANDHGASLHVGISKDPRAWRPRAQARTYLYKMHGCISQAVDRNLVVTEEDYINFLANALSHNEKKSLLPYVLGKISESLLLFIGYSLADWNFRVVFKATAEKYNATGYAVQYFDRPTASEYDQLRWNALVHFWDKKKIDIINVDAEVFVQDLVEAIREVAPRETVSLVSSEEAVS